MNSYGYRPTRIGFSKLGVAKYISHLDLMRCITRAVKRSGLKVWFSEGFNPRMYLTFALPLSLGYEGEEESFEIRLMEDLTEEEVAKALAPMMPKGLTILGASFDFMPATAVRSATYQAIIAPIDHHDDLEASWSAFLAQPEMTVEKKSKRGMKSVDIKPDMTVVSSSVEEDRLVLTVNLPAGDLYTLNPRVVQEAFERFTGWTMHPMMVKRTEIFAEEQKIFR